MSTVRLRSSKGFTLIEVLVALLIVGVGMLGIAALVLFSMRASFESGLQTYAAILAVDVHETAWLAAHTPRDPATIQDCATIGVLEEQVNGTLAIVPLGDLGRFAPNLTIPNLEARVTGTYPVCVFEVSWGEEADAGSFGVVGQMAGFGGVSGGTFIHQFVIPSI